MLPDFDKNGNLPPGVHPATLEEIIDRFGWQSEVRRAQAESLRWLVELARRAGAERVVVNGSFVTNKPEPNDVDCLVLTRGGYPHDRCAADELHGGLPFLEIQFVAESTFNVFVSEIFGLDRDDNPKGMVEVVL